MNKQTLSSQYLDSTDLTNRLIQEMKAYIMRNHSKVDFSEMSILMNQKRHGVDGIKQIYYAPKDLHLSSEVVPMLSEKIDTIEFVLDGIDGDFSVTINGRYWMWIEDELVGRICRYIEQSISNNINLK